jgi:methionyl-tRNA formyltransferase
MRRFISSASFQTCHFFSEAVRKFSIATSVSTIQPSKILFFGTDDFSLPTLKNLHKLTEDPTSSVTTVDVVTTSDVRRSPKAKPTPVPVKEFAMENNLRIHEIPPGTSPMALEDHLIFSKDSEDRDSPAKASDFDLGVVVSFGYFIPKSIISSLRLGAINVHPSLLPAYRGAAPITWSILRGDDMTGISVIEVDPENFDCGNILLQVKEQIFPDEMYLSARERLSVLGADCLSAAIRNMELGVRPNLPQMREVETTPAWKLTTRHGKIRFVTQGSANTKKRKQLQCGSLNLCDSPTSRELYNRWRALSETVGVSVDWLYSERHAVIKTLRLIKVGFPENFKWENNDGVNQSDDVSVGTMIWCTRT